MTVAHDTSKAKQIRNLLAVVISAVMVAFVIMFGMLYSSGSAGTYSVKNVLLSPESAKALYFNDVNPNTGTVSRFVFHQIEFSYYDNVQKIMKRIEIPLSKYAKFYEMVGNENSLLDLTGEAANAFSNNLLATLNFKVRAEGNTLQNGSKVFSETEFTDDFYRISLRSQDFGKQWVYFKHPGILEQVLEIFNSP